MQLGVNIDHVATLRQQRLGRVPDPVEEDSLYQTMLAAWPIDADRLAPLLVKAARERKVRTSWLRPSTEHEETLTAIVTHVLVHEIGHHFGLSDDDMIRIEADAEPDSGTTVQ